MAILVFGTVMIWIVVFGAMAVVPLLLELTGQREGDHRTPLRVGSLKADGRTFGLGDDIAA